MSGSVTLRWGIADVRTFAIALADPWGGYGSKLVLAIGLAYPFGPIDLIPNSLPVIGYLDQVGFVLGGIALAYLLLPSDSAKAGSPGGYLWLPPPSAVRARLTGWARAKVLDSFAWLFARPILRLSTGAWPTPADV